MKVAMLGSGSRGNSTVAWTEQTCVLVDAGFSGRQLASRLAAVGVEPEGVDAILLTHEHGDHVRGAGIFARRYGTPLLMSAGTREAVSGLLHGGEAVEEYRPGSRFGIGDIEVDAFLTAHDAVDPVAVTLTGRECGSRVGVATDLGRPTAAIRHSLAELDVLILEANHDEGLLRVGPYPASVQARIASSHGHLSNEAAARLAVELLTDRLLAVHLAHLSAECNRPELAREVVERELRRAGFDGPVTVVPQDRPGPVVDIPAERARSGPDQLRLL